MRFEKTLKSTTYSPWKDQYIDYTKLKKLLRETSSIQESSIEGDDDDEWTEQDEGAFVEELINVQLEKVHSFQRTTNQRLRDETTAIEKMLEPLGVKATEDGGKASTLTDGKKKKILQDGLTRLEKVTKEINELEKYSRINYTGFLKAAKKHDRRRGQLYRVGPLLRVRLSALPFNSEDYSPLVFKLSTMFSFVRQSLDGKDLTGLTFEEGNSTDKYMAHKFWVHPENILEVKTILLRRLPVLIFNPQTSKVAEGSERDPTVTSIYFDDPKFSLYQQKIAHQEDASSLRLRWYGQLSEQSEIIIEKKVIKSESDESEEKRFHIKPKYILPFASGEYSMEKTISKLEERAGRDSAKPQQFKDAVNDIRDFITTRKVQPMLRANYTRTAFEIPGDDRIRVSLDTNLAFIREDALDTQRPCRDPKDWHRSDIDKNQMEYPFTAINKGEINRLPFAILEIKVRGGKNYEWIQDLMSSHLVKEVPRFSKFIHGSAVLFEDYVNSFPFWLSLAETDIRTDPQTAFNEEQERKAVQAAENQVVGSLFGSKASPAGARRSSMRATYGSPIASSPMKSSLERSNDFGKATPEMTRIAVTRGTEPIAEAPDSDEDDVGPSAISGTTSGLRSLFPSFSTSKFAQKHRALPPGVTKPEYWLKDQGSLKVEAKVWLANQRTFVKWQHVTVLLASLSLGLFNAAGRDNAVARALAYIYTAFALFAGAWGYGVYMWRGNLIRQRSAKDFDNRLGPVVVCGGLAVALILNFGFKIQAALASHDSASSRPNQTFSYPHAGEL